MELAASFFQTYEDGDNILELPQTKEPIYILGQSYNAQIDKDAIEDDIYSRIWFTYRRGFQQIGNTGFTSDQGWGCMIRCGQMILAQSLIHLHLTRKWRWRSQHDPKYFQILRLFLDRKDSCYSIHQIVSMGECEGKPVGQWFGPNTISQVLRKLVPYDFWSDMVIHVSIDNMLIIDEIISQCLNSPITEYSKSITTNCSNVWKPLLLLIPLRLGLSEINPTYFKSFKKCFELKQSVGVIGGKPSHAHWFIGYTENNLFYLDPHLVQPYVDFSNPNDSDVSFHSKQIRFIDIHLLDPSISLGFFCLNIEDFDDLMTNLKFSILSDSRSSMFEIHDTRPKIFAYNSKTLSGKVGFSSEDDFEML